MSQTPSGQWEQIRKLSEAYCEAFFKAMKPALQELSKRGTELQEVAQNVGEAIPGITKTAQLASRIAEVNDALKEEGWFVPPLLPEGQITRLHQLTVVNRDSDTAIAELIGYCDDGLAAKIIDAACSHKAFENRTVFLRQALQAHMEGKFALSIPVFLTQAEGAYRQILEVSKISNNAPLYNTKEWKEAFGDDLAGELPITEIVLAVVLRGFSASMSEQFTARVTSIVDLERLRARYPKGFLSRHAVLHGRDNQYATKENSIRALFILDTVRELVNKLL